MFNIEKINFQDKEEKNKNMLYQQIQNFNLSYEKLLNQVEKLLEKKNLNIVQVTLVVYIRNFLMKTKN
jgi:hypothetical protein